MSHTANPTIDNSACDTTALPSPTSEAAKKLQEQLRPALWPPRVSRAQGQADVVARVRELMARGLSETQALHQVSPNTPWPTYQYWRARVDEGEEVCWESFLDRRLPPQPKVVPEIIRACAITMRTMQPDVGYHEAREKLVKQHGPAGDISDTSLWRIWHDAGLVDEAPQRKHVEHFTGGAALAMIAAASHETGSTIAMAEALQAEGEEAVARQPERELEPEPAGRDERGRLTAEYNKSTRVGVEPGDADARWLPDYEKRENCELQRIPLLGQLPETVAQKILAVAAVPLITARRGFDGVDGPQGEWLKVLCNVA